MSSLGDTMVTGVVTQSQPATADAHLLRLGEGRSLFNSLFQGNWDSATTYEPGESVNDGGSFYVCLLENTNKQPGANPTQWRVAAAGGASSYTYIGYATDGSGTGFSLSPAGKTYVAFKTTTSPIGSPAVGDFAGLWAQFVGNLGSVNSDAISEGSSNKYYTDARVRACVLTGLNTGTGGAIVAADTVLQGLGKAEHRLAAIEAWTTDSLTEGSSNKYYTDGRARGAVSGTAPITYNSSTGAIGVNASSANTVSYVVQRDSNGDFAGRKIVLGGGSFTDHITLGGVTMGYNGTVVAFGSGIGTATIALGSSHELRTAGGQVQFYSNTAAANVFTTVDGVFVIASARLTGLSGVLKADGSGNVSGSATTDALSEGSTNLYYTSARVNTAADARITLQRAAANGLATLDSGGKLTSSQLPASVVGAVVYQGTWNATTNSPALAGGSGTKGQYYQVATAGSTNLDGVTDWKVGDWAIYNGAAWEKVDNTDAVASVNGFTGTVVIGSDAVAEGSTNLYYTDARVRACVLTGLSTATGGAIVAGDTTLQAFGKAEHRVAAMEAWTTTNLTEGANLYYTDARVKTVASAGLNAVVIGPGASTSGSPNLLTVTGPGHTGLTASTEAADVYLNLARVVQFATGGLATQRAVRVDAPKYAFVATSTLTDASTVGIGGAPVAWSNATITNAAALRIYAGAVAGGNTNAYGLYVDAPTGGVNNYGGVIASGNFGIGTAAPSALLDVNGTVWRLRTSKTPSSASDTGNAGDHCWDAGFLYVCVATNTWKRAAVATW